MGEKPPEEEKPAELYPIMGLAQKRTRKDLFEVCFCYTCVYFFGGFGMLSTCNQQLASAYSMIARVRHGTSIAIVLPTHINKPEYIFQLSMGMVRTQDIPAERELSQSQPTKRLVSHEVECISLVSI